MNLNNSWSELYAGGNWFDAKVAIQNLLSSPVAIDVKVSRVYLTWTSGSISGAGYKTYTVYAKTAPDETLYYIRGCSNDLFDVKYLHP